MKLVKLIFIILMFALPAFADMTDAELKAMGKSSANTLGKELQKSYSDPKDAKNKLANPLVSETKMNTLSDSWKCPDNGKTFLNSLECNNECESSCVKNDFTATIQCASSEEALIITPAGFGTGGEVTLQVAFDTDLDGTKDQVFTTSNISGFCTNGYVSCTPGTWQNCKYYEFGVKHKNASGTVFNTYRECAATGVCTPADNKVTATARTAVEMRHAGGCYCTNASCGSSFNATFQQSLGAFGGGISAHLMNDLGLVISDTKIDTATLSIKYLAASTTSCLEAESNVGELKKYYQTDNIPADDELIVQLSDSDSELNLVLEAHNTSSEITECSIRNTPIIKEGDLEYWCTLGMESTDAYIFAGEGEHTYRMVVSYACIDSDGDGRGDAISTELDYYMYSDGSGNRRRTDCDQYTPATVFLSSLGSDDTGKAATGTTCRSGSLRHARIAPYILCSDTTCRLHIKAIADSRDGVDSRQFNKTEILSAAKSEELTVSRNNNCLMFEQDNKCKVYEEEINNIYTVKNFNQTGMIINSECKEIRGGATRYIVCDHGDRFDVEGLSRTILTSEGTQVISSNSNYSVSTRKDGLERFEIKRRYVCETEQQHDFSSTKAQADIIGNSLNPDTGDFNYLVDGQIKSGNVKIDKDAYDSCTYSCVVQTGNQDTEVFPDQETRRTTADIVTEERPCGVDRNTAERTCPYDQLTESIIKDCTCTSAFNQVIAGFGIVSDAVKDMICSGD